MTVRTDITRTSGQHLTRKITSSILCRRLFDCCSICHRRNSRQIAPLIHKIHPCDNKVSTMGKGGEKSVAPTDGVLEVLIDGRFYDVSKMKHPGGSVIKFYAGKGIDATQAFDNFHIRSKKAKKILDHLPSRIADKKETEQNLLPGQASLLEDFNQLTRDCKCNGISSFKYYFNWKRI